MRTNALRLLCVLSFVVLTVPSLLADEEGNRARATLRRMESIATAIEAYTTDHNEAPRAASFDALVPLLTPRYMREVPLRDGWDTPFRYVRTGAQSFQLVSAGSDRAFDEKSWSTAAQTEELAADAVYVANAQSTRGSFHRTWTRFGAPLHRSAEEWQELARPLVESETEKMKGMSDAQSRSYLRTSSTLRDLQVLGLFLKAYKMKHGRYPAATSMAELEPMLFPEITSEVTKKDKWGTELRYVVARDGQSYRLVSAGGDEMFDETSWTKQGKLVSDDEDAVLENGELVRKWTEETRPGLGSRAKLQPKARELLARADARLQAGDHAGALNAYMDAVKADRAAAELEAIHRYAAPFGFAAPAPGSNPPRTPAEATAAHIAALRQFLTIQPGHADAERELVLILPDGEAVAFMSDMLKRRPQDAELYRLRSQVRFRAGHYTEGLADLEHATTLDSSNAELFYMVGVAAYEIAAKHSESSTPDQKRELVRRGLAAFARAESLRADYFESLTYRQLLLREQAKLESDPAIQQKLIAEADAVRQRALDVIKARREKAAAAAAADTPSARSETTAPADGTAYRVGGDVKAPLVRHRVPPVIPEEARKAGVAGIVIMEVIIDREGRVRSTKVLKPLPYGLSEAAVEAVKQWTFEPGTLNGQPVDVIFNLTVNIKPE